MESETFDLKYRVTKEDFRAAMKAQARHSAARLWLTRGMMALVVCAGLVAAAGWWSTGGYVDAALALIVLICAALAPAINIWSQDRTYVAKRVGESEMRFIANEKGFRVSSKRGENRHAWSALTRIDATPGPIVLWLSANRMVIVPRQAFGADIARRDVFLNMARSQAGGGAG